MLRVEEQLQREPVLDDFNLDDQHQIESVAPWQPLFEDGAAAVFLADHCRKLLNRSNSN